MFLFGILFLINCFLTMYIILSGIPVMKKSPLILFCGAYLLGVSIIGSVLYLIDAGSMSMFKRYDFTIGAAQILLTAFNLIMLFKRGKGKELNEDFFSAFSSIPKNIVICIFLVFCTWFFFHTFSLKNGDIETNAAWFDIMYHHAYVRTISEGANMPVSYPYFAKHPMAYHFMYDYYTAKVASAGLNSVIALNIMSIFSLLSLMVLMIEVSELLFKNFWIGVLASFFLMCHSSLALFIYLSGDTNGLDAASILKNGGWIWHEFYEAWALFNSFVLTNQRHFPFALAVTMFYAGLVFLIRKHKKTSIDYKVIVLLALSVGVLPYFNAPAAVLIVMTIGLFSLVELFKRNKHAGIELFWGAFFAGILVLPQLLLLKNSGEALSGYPTIRIGYDAGSQITAIVRYYWNTLGLKIPLYIIAFAFIRKKYKPDLIIFFIPFVIANVLQLGSIFYDNNKLMWITIIFMNVYDAWLIISLVKYALTKKIYVKTGLIVLSGILIIGMSATGVFDIIGASNMGKVLLLDKNSDLKAWIQGNTSKDAEFLTWNQVPYGDSPITTVNLAGRLLYGVSSMVDSSCDTTYRVELMKQIYQNQIGTADDTRQVLQKEGISFIIIDQLLRAKFNENNLILDEKFFDDNFQIVYTEDNTKIYSVE